MNFLRGVFLCLLAGLTPLALVSCSGGGTSASLASGSDAMTVAYTNPLNSPLGYGSPSYRVSPQQMYRQARVEKDFIRLGTHSRKDPHSMRPRYITIHSTQNYSPSADARRHALALKNGKIRARKRAGVNRTGHLYWHYSVDQDICVQHIPDTEQGEHADFEGPGNHYSIGIEMCENRGNSRAKTVDRTAKLTAYLMWKYDIPVQHVVPHYHWPRHGLSKPHKNCPHYLLDGGKPGAKWKWFQDKVSTYHRSIAGPQAPVL
ncbi:peptidoglycan recognition protein family protein [Rubritalea marina]|uniref:peptidoglycan recognition protein family protein n=1 Tax=Rubritalea marina TaxID=361055 RepID=UPI000366D3F9|nr:N-acetylmuramoyl-L-alanine amidase [Rubritalea marina]